MSFPHPSGNERPSFWIETTPSTAYPPVQEDASADVVVVGGGMVGITAAYLLAKAGKSVIVVDRERIAMAETGHTTAHLQIVVDTPLRDLVRMLGHDNAKLAWDSQLEAVRLIEEHVREQRISCDLMRLDAYLYSPKEEDGGHVHDEMVLARSIGYEAFEASPDDVPFACKHAIRYPDQGKFHPRKYLLQLAHAAQRMGVRFFEGTEIADIDAGSPMVAKTRDGHKLQGEWLIEATNVPFSATFRMHHKLMSYRTYAIGARVPRGVFADKLYWDTLDPYHYTRVETDPEGHPLVILGGADHEVGHVTQTQERFTKLEEYLRTATTDFEVRYRWSGEWIETPDKLPMIGPMPAGHARHLIATGDSGTGMTNGTLAGLMLAERVLGRGTPWDGLYAPERVPHSGQPMRSWVEENVSNTRKLVAGRLKGSDVDSLERIRPGEGVIVSRGFKKLAVSRGTDGRLHALNATCTHMGCIVAWNRAEQSWDCPCHGGRYAPTGEILHGPPPDPLAQVDLEEAERALQDAQREG